MFAARQMQHLPASQRHAAKHRQHAFVHRPRAERSAGDEQRFEHRIEPESAGRFFTRWGSGDLLSDRATGHLQLAAIGRADKTRGRIELAANRPHQSHQELVRLAGNDIRIEHRRRDAAMGGFADGDPRRIPAEPDHHRRATLSKQRLHLVLGFPPTLVKAEQPAYGFGGRHDRLRHKFKAGRLQDDPIDLSLGAEKHAAHVRPHRAELLCDRDPRVKMPARCRHQRKRWSRIQTWTAGRVRRSRGEGQSRAPVGKIGRATMGRVKRRLA